jgi:hypothetical protein
VSSLPWRLLSRRAPAAGSIIVRPRIQFKAIERDSLAADRDLRKKRTNPGVEAIHVHAEIPGRVAQPKESRWSHGSVRALFVVARVHLLRRAHTLVHAVVGVESETKSSASSFFAAELCSEHPDACPSSILKAFSVKPG